MLKIVQIEDKVLRKKAEEIPLGDIASPKIQKLITEMRETLSFVPDGVALAAPQVGESLRLFVLSPKIKNAKNLVYINPKIIKKSSSKATQEEGCLSVRPKYGKIERYEKVTIEAYDENGKKFTRGASGLMAEAFQHETEHLDGILFIDNARNIRDIHPPENPRVAFFGTPRFARIVLEKLQEENFHIVAIVTAPDKPTGRKKMLTPSSVKEWAREENNKRIADKDSEMIGILEPEKLDNKFAEDLLSYSPDVIAVAAYGKIIPQDALWLAPYEALNVHPSLLPKYRGAAPIQSAILEGEKETGVSIILMDDKMDHGPILATKKVSLSGWKPDYLELEEKLAEEGGKLLADSIPRWIKGEIIPKIQDHDSASFTKKIDTANAEISPENIDSPESERKIRAFFPNPGAFAIFNTKNGTKIRAKILPGKRITPDGRKEISWQEFERNYLN